ncbi:MAG TPA: GNAT family N-acetyltransferase [Solirubrobacteraceae bacterium]|nr:GNAT family N-acetyltransferase [Solirubrobacteraceae bacterium]
MDSAADSDDRAPVSPTADAIRIRVATDADRACIERLLRGSWGATTVVSRGRVHDASRLPALLSFAAEGGDPLGLATLSLENGECELVTLDAFPRRRGVGSALLSAAADWARARGCRRLWLITSNDNLDAVRFYQRRGLRLVAVHRGAVDRARELKPGIPEVGEYGIAIHDELELELALSATLRRRGWESNKCFGRA